VFDDEGPDGREMTVQALDALGTCVTYLRGCLGPAHGAAIPDSATLSAVLVALHVACTQLHAGLQPALSGIDRRQWPADQAQVPITRVAAIRAAVAAASDALLIAATRFADAHAAATHATPPRAATAIARPRSDRPTPAGARTHPGTGRGPTEVAQPVPPSANADTPPTEPGA
jgi:hypothetical protein